MFGWPERDTPMDNAIRHVSFVASTVNGYRLWHDVRRVAVDDIRRTVTEVTGMLVSDVRLVAPAEIGAEMLLWPPRQTLWDRNVIDELRMTLENERALRLDVMRDLVTREIDDFAKSGIYKNFSRSGHELQDQLVRQFGKVAGDVCANHIALTYMNGATARTDTKALVSLMVTASPFMTRDPLDPHTLLMLVNDD